MNWPTEADCGAFYGKMGENQTSLVLPYPMVLAWDSSCAVKKFTCHEKVVDPLRRIFASTLKEYGITKIHALGLDLFGGCLNVRLKRGSRKEWSIHSWGVAVDLDPDHNELRQNHTTARFARPEYGPFWRIVEGEGATSYGHARDFDWMHFQFARP